MTNRMMIFIISSYQHHLNQNQNQYQNVNGRVRIMTETATKQRRERVVMLYHLTPIKLTNEHLDQFIFATVSNKESLAIFEEYEANGDVIIPSKTSKQRCKCRINGCNKSYKSKHHLKRHVDEMHTGRLYICDIDPKKNLNKDLKQENI